MEKIKAVIFEEISKIAKVKRMDFVFDKRSVYYGNTEDFTQQLIDRINKKSGGRASAGNASFIVTMLDLNKLQSLIGGQWCLQGKKPVITGVAEIAEAGSNDLIYAVDRRRVDLIKDSECGLAILPRGIGM